MMELRKLRKSLGIKRIQLAKNLDVNVKSVNRWEKVSPEEL